MTTNQKKNGKEVDLYYLSAFATYCRSRKFIPNKLAKVLFLSDSKQWN